MENSQRKWSRITQNRFAVVVVSGSVLLLGGLVLLYWVGLFDQIAAMQLLEITSVPLYLIVGLLVLVTVVWGWQRLISFFD